LGPAPQKKYKLPTQPRQPAINPPLARDDEETSQTSYGARINQLFRDAIRDLEEMKCHPRPSEANASRGEEDPGG
jgi:hypothetical protein